MSLGPAYFTTSSAQALIRALRTDYEEHGAQAIADLRRTNPAQYLKLVAGLLGKEDTYRFSKVLERFTADEIERIEAFFAQVLHEEERSGSAE